jgi:16S rRNA (guanine(966)-N(2))-methyltransferase RsmD
MRIISGKNKGLRFNPPQNIPTRPTTDFAKEGLFNFLSNYYNFDNIKFLDLFGGTGSISYEFASRGCTDITNIEKFPKCAAFIQKTATEMKFVGFKSYCMDVFTYIDNCHESYDLIFAGPPYALENLNAIPDIIIDKKLIDGAGWFIMEHNPNHNFDNHPHFYTKRNYGDTIFSIFTNEINNKD